MNELNAFIKEQTNKISETYDSIKKYKASLSYFNKNPIIDEDKSVRWNREEIQRKKYELNVDISTAKANIVFYKSEIRAAIIRYIMQEYNMSQTQAAFIFEKGYNDCHEYGYDEIISKSKFYAKTIKEYLALDTNN